MKPSTSLPAAREFAGTEGSHPLRQSLCWTLAGFGVGVVSATAYLLLGGKYFLFIPRWACIVFYPGFTVGNAVYDWGLSQEAAKVVGVIAVGLAYGLLAWLARLVWFMLKRHRQSAAVAEAKRTGLYQGSDPAQQGKSVPAARTFSMRKPTGGKCQVISSVGESRQPVFWTGQTGSGCASEPPPASPARCLPCHDSRQRYAGKNEDCSSHRIR
jgi:hypothetical protein